jgi:hypothetical protein
VTEIAQTLGSALLTGAFASILSFLKENRFAPGESTFFARRHLVSCREA